MNDQLQDYARAKLRRDLFECTEAQQLVFKRMYSHKNLEASIGDIVDNMPEEKLDWAMDQVKRTVDENQKTESKG